MAVGSTKTQFQLFEHERVHRPRFVGLDRDVRVIQLGNPSAELIGQTAQFVLHLRNDVLLPPDAAQHDPGREVCAGNLCLTITLSEELLYPLVEDFLIDTEPWWTARVRNIIVDLLRVPRDDVD